MAIGGGRNPNPAGARAERECAENCMHDVMVARRALGERKGNSGWPMKREVRRRERGSMRGHDAASTTNSSATESR